RLLEHRMFRAPAVLHFGDAQPYAALRGEFESVRKQVLENLLQALGIGGQAASEIGIEVDLERKLASVRLMTERTRDHIEKVRKRDFFGVHRHGPGFDLR